MYIESQRSKARILYFTLLLVSGSTSHIFLMLWIAVVLWMRQLADIAQLYSVLLAQELIGAALYQANL